MGKMDAVYEAGSLTMRFDILVGGEDIAHAVLEEQAKAYRPKVVISLNPASSHSDAIPGLIGAWTETLSTEAYGALVARDIRVSCWSHLACSPPAATHGPMAPVMGDRVSLWPMDPFRVLTVALKDSTDTMLSRPFDCAIPGLPFVPPSDPGSHETESGQMATGMPCASIRHFGYDLITSSDLLFLLGHIRQEDVPWSVACAAFPVDFAQALLVWAESVC